jgi:hypothetical protein
MTIVIIYLNFMQFARYFPVVKSFSILNVEYRLQSPSMLSLISPKAYCIALSSQSGYKMYSEIEACLL